MKHLLSILILLGFISTALAQQSFKPLSEFNQDHDISIDNGALTYVLQRCSALYNTVQALIIDQDKELSDKQFEASVFLGNLAVMLHASIKDLDLGTAEKEVADLIKAKVTIYLEDAKANYIKTGSYVMDTYIESDLTYCKVLAEGLDKGMTE